MRIGLVQMHCEKGATAHNPESMAHCLHEAVERKVDILGFPEMSITGYADPTRYPEAVLRLDGPGHPPDCGAVRIARVTCL